MYCPTCRTHIIPFRNDEGFLVCPHCGTVLDEYNEETWNLGITFRGGSNQLIPTSIDRIGTNDYSYARKLADIWVHEMENETSSTLPGYLSERITLAILKTSTIVNKPPSKLFGHSKTRKKSYAFTATYILAKRHKISTKSWVIRSYFNQLLKTIPRHERIDVQRHIYNYKAKAAERERYLLGKAILETTFELGIYTLTTTEKIARFATTGRLKHITLTNKLHRLFAYTKWLAKKNNWFLVQEALRGTNIRPIDFSNPYIRTILTKNIEKMGLI